MYVPQSVYKLEWIHRWSKIPGDFLGVFDGVFLLRLGSLCFLGVFAEDMDELKDMDALFFDEFIAEEFKLL